MDYKNRLPLAVSITLIIVLAIFASFGRILMDLEHTPQVKLPPIPSEQETLPGPGTQAEPLHWIEVTPQTVQAVVASLSRAESYYQKISSELFWDGGSGLSHVSVYLHSDWAQVEVHQPSGFIRRELIGNGMVYSWYDGSSQWFSAPAAEHTTDLAQQIPTYETVLALTPDHITAAEYRELDGVPVIFVEMRVDELSYLERYWVGVESGLLLSAETEKNETIVYRMETLALETPCPITLELTLPDGTYVPLLSSLPSPPTP